MKIHGATVHFVRAEMDTGPIIAQGAVPVLPDDTPETLAARVLKAEHRIYPLALRLVAGGAREGRWRARRHRGRKRKLATMLVSPSRPA